MDFMAIDFETANTSHSPCSLGLTIVENNSVINCKSFLFNPNEPFSQSCINVHGITPKDVANSPEFPIVWESITPLFSKYPIAAHNISFDYDVLMKVLSKYNLKAPEMELYCTLQLARKNFPEIGHFNLPALCEYFNVSLDQHHCCDSDSLACALLLIKMMQTPSFKLFSYTPAVFSPSHTSNSYTAMFETPDYDEASVEYDDMWSVTFDQKVFVVTGDIEGYSREDIKKLIEQYGGTCRTSVSKKVDYLIVGMQNKNVIKNKVDAKSEKIIKAEQLREDGFPIRIISDEDFLQLVHRRNNSDLGTNESDWFSFYDESDKIRKLKAWGLLPRTAMENKQLYYCGIYSRGDLVKSEVIGYVNSNIAVINLLDEPHKIHADYLKEMQPTNKEAETVNG